MRRDPETHLYSRGHTWEYQNEAADHYASLVFVAHYVAPQYNEPGGTLHQTMVNSRKLCASPDGIPREYDLRLHKPGSKATFPKLSEWLRDGLIRIVEIEGTDNIWYDELLRLTDAMLQKAKDGNGLMQTFQGAETAGNMLQTLTRLYALSGEEKYLLAAEKIADGYLLHSKNDIINVHFRDHGCELVPGLAELFVLESKLGRSKANEYREPLKRILDRILARSAHPTTGLFCEKAKGADGKIQWSQPPDTWGYVLFAFENFDRATESGRYREAIEKPLRWLIENDDNRDKHKKTLWPRAKNDDDWSDSHESMIVLWNRYPEVGDGFAWLDNATLQAVHRRGTEKTYGPFSGGHHDGSTGRCLVSHMMLCSQGTRGVPFQEGVGVGAVQKAEELFLTVQTETPYRGKLCFDSPRNEHAGATIDWARINEMPQWFFVRPEETYSVTINEQPPRAFKGQALIDGLAIELNSGETRKIRVKRMEPAYLVSQCDRDGIWSSAREHGHIYAECASGTRQLLHGWIEYKRDPATHLYPRDRQWNYADLAADNYSSLVLMAHYVDPDLNQETGTLHQTLVNSIRLCTTESGLPASYDLKKHKRGQVSVHGVCEWLRDGLVRIVELLGTNNQWHRELVRLTDAVLAEGERQGGILSLVKTKEDRGNLLQVLARLGALTGESRYLEAAERIADEYLLDDPLEKLSTFSFVDHGCELVPGLSELFVLECRLQRPRGKTYREPLERLLDRLLVVGRHPESGLWYCRANLQGAQPAGQGQPKPRKSGAPMPDVPHCWGYVLFAFENYDLATNEQRYRSEIEKPMRWLVDNRDRFEEVRYTQWPWNHSTGCFGDSYESMIILWNRYRDVPGVSDWLDWTTQIAGFREERTSKYGPGVGIHNDGCTGRNLCAHMMLQSQGVRAVPYKEGVRCGAVRRGQSLYLLVEADRDWSGRLCFDPPRNAWGVVPRTWARINEMPRWFVVDPDSKYTVQIDGHQAKSLSGYQLVAGLETEIQSGQSRRFLVSPSKVALADPSEVQNTQTSCIPEDALSTNLQHFFSEISNLW